MIVVFHTIRIERKNRNRIIFRYRMREIVKNGASLKSVSLKTISFKKYLLRDMKAQLYKGMKTTCSFKGSIFSPSKRDDLRL